MHPVSGGAKIVSTYQEMEAFWRAEWQNAKQSLEAARRRRKDIEEANSIQTVVSEDYFAYGQALKAENLALTKYARLTRVYTDFLLHRKLPDT